MFIVSASKLETEIKKALKDKKPTVFLGGSCEDNSWREELKKEFSGKFFFLDPYDSHWDAEDNIYDELAGISNADYVVFYKGGKGTEREKRYLNNLKVNKGYKEYSNLDPLKGYLKNLSFSVVKKSAAEYIRSIVAKLGQTYSFSSTQINLPENLAKKVIEWGKKNIPEKNLHIEEDGGMGRENEIHVTVLYGITDENKENTEKIIKKMKIKPFDVLLGTISAFKDDKNYDVLKIDVDSPELHKLHYTLEENVENKNSHPTYNAHVTIAYVKKGTVDDLIGGDAFRGMKFRADSIEFSSKNSEKTKIALV